MIIKSIILLSLTVGISNGQPAALENTPNECLESRYLINCPKPEVSAYPVDGGDQLGLNTIFNGGANGASSGLANVTRVMAAHIWTQRDQLCSGFSFNTIFSSTFNCLSEAVSTFEAPDCDVETELEWDLFFEDRIEVSTNTVTDTNFRIGRCPGQEAQGGDPLNITLEDLKILKIKPSPVHTFPEIGVENPRVVNLPVVVYTDSGVQMFTPTLLGQSVQVRVAPVSFTFAWGDGTVLGPVASPGSADVESDYQHTYTSLDPVRISVTTQWSASWSVDGSTWVRIPGFLETTGTSAQLPIVEKVPLLVPDK